MNALVLQQRKRTVQLLKMDAQVETICFDRKTSNAPPGSAPPFCGQSEKKLLLVKIQLFKNAEKYKIGELHMRNIFSVFGMLVLVLNKYLD